MTGAVENLLAWRALATPDELIAGREWYAEAGRFVRHLQRAHGTRYSRAQIAAVVATLSPNCAWVDNKSAAESLLRAHATNPEAALDASYPGVYSQNVRKAVAILDGPRVPLVCDGTRIGARGTRVKCSGETHGCYAHLHGPKVAEFYRTILGDLEGRTMDVWATRAADIHPEEDDLSLGPDDPRRAGNPSGRMHDLQSAYSAAAAIIGEHPAHLQAQVWLAIRRLWRRADGRRNGARN